MTQSWFIFNIIIFYMFYMIIYFFYIILTISFKSESIRSCSNPVDDGKIRLKPIRNRIFSPKKLTND